jgi:hypothetical protein
VELARTVADGEVPPSCGAAAESAGFFCVREGKVSEKSLAARYFRLFFVLEGSRSGLFPGHRNRPEWRKYHKPAQAEAAGSIITRCGKPKRKFRMMNCGNVIDNGSKGSAIPLALALCLGTLCVPQARAQVSPKTTTNSLNVSVNFVTTTTTQLNPGFNGFNGNMKNAVEYYDTNFQQILTTLSPGWLRFPGGTDSEAFDWVSGEIVSAWVDALASNSYQHDINAAAQPIVAGKGGSSFSDFAALAANVGDAKIIVSVNAFTDTPQSAQAFAQYALTNHIPVAAWELANEPYTWIKSGAFFTDATDYANKMKPYRDAIKAADPNAVVALYFSEAGHPNTTWDNALAGSKPLPETGRSS